jgi:hypothetical protein
MTDRTPAAIRKRAWALLRHKARSALAFDVVGLSPMLIEPGLVTAIEKIANDEPQADPRALLDAAAAILDLHISARQVMRPDPSASGTIH